MEEFEEWRVTGSPGDGYAVYDFVWSPDRNPHLGDPETGARVFMSLGGKLMWESPPRLWKRKVTRTEWEAVE